MDVMNLIEGWRERVVGNEVDIHSSGFYRSYYGRKWNMVNMLEV